MVVDQKGFVRHVQVSSRRVLRTENWDDSRLITVGPFSSGHRMSWPSIYQGLEILPTELGRWKSGHNILGNHPEHAMTVTAVAELRTLPGCAVMSPSSPGTCLAGGLARPPCVL